MIYLYYKANPTGERHNIAPLVDILELTNFQNEIIKPFGWEESEIKGF